MLSVQRSSGPGGNVATLARLTHLTPAAQPTGKIARGTTDSESTQADLEGLSLEHCVLDIVLGRVSLQRVVRIVTVDDLSREHDWHKAVVRYKATVWEAHAGLAVSIAQQLWYRGKIVHRHDSRALDRSVRKQCWRLVPDGRYVDFAPAKVLPPPPPPCASSRLTRVARGALWGWLTAAALAGVVFLSSSRDAMRTASANRAPIDLQVLVFDKDAAADARVVHELSNAYGAFKQDLASARELYPDVTFLSTPLSSSVRDKRPTARAQKIMTVTRFPWAMSVVRIQNPGSLPIALSTIEGLYEGSATAALEVQELPPAQSTTVFLFSRSEGRPLLRAARELNLSR